MQASSAVLSSEENPPIVRQSHGVTVAPRSWLREHDARTTWLLMLAHAVTFALSFPPFGVWALMPISIALLSAASVGAKRGRTVGFAAGVIHVSMWLLMTQWLIAVTPVGYPMKAVAMTLFTLGFVAILRSLHGHRLFRAWPYTALVPIVWTGVECFRGEIAFHGYPWYFAAHPMIGALAWVQSADLLGTYFVSFLTAAAGGAIVDFIKAWRRGVRPSSAIALFVFAVVASMNIVYGLFRMQEQNPISPGARVAAVQTNLPQDNKVGWTPEQQAKDMPEFIALTRGAVADSVDAMRGVDLVVWPETMLPGIGFESDMIEQVLRFSERSEQSYEHLWRWQRELLQLADELSVPMIVGSTAWTEPSMSEQNGMLSLVPQRRFNSVYVIAGAPPYQRYDKFFLTPFGETMPYISEWPWLEERLLAIGAAGMSFDLDAGESLSPLSVDVSVDGDSMPPRRIRFGTPICFEDSVAWVCRRMVYHEGAKQSDMLINVSNDGWFGEHDAIRALHLGVARFRCIENRVPMVRAVNTGYSASIDSCGRITAKSGSDGFGTPRQAGWVVTKVMLDSRHSLYGWVGDLWAFGCAVLTAGMLLLTIIIRQRSAT